MLSPSRNLVSSGPDNVIESPLMIGQLVMSRVLIDQEMKASDRSLGHVKISYWLTCYLQWSTRPPITLSP